MKRRLISFLLVLCMVFTMLPVTALAAENDTDLPDNPFTDVANGSWYYDAVMYVYHNGLFNGVTATTFVPNGTMTRGMFVTVLGRMAGVDPADYRGAAGFVDVAEDAYYAPYVKWAAAHGITQGTDADHFSPNLNINRQQMATFFVRYFELFGVDYTTGLDIATQPSDLDAVAGWARDAVLKLWKQGLLNGDGGKFDPTGSATRAQTATLCMRTDAVVDPWYSEPGVVSDRVKVDPGTTGDSSGSTNGSTNGGTPDSGDSDSQPTGSEICTVTFYDGDRLVDMISTGRNQALGCVPDNNTSSKEGYILVGWYTDPACTKPFYAENPVTESCKVYAKYEKMAGTEVLNLTVFTQMDVKDMGLSFKIKKIPGAVGAVSAQNAAAVTVKDGTAPVAITVTDAGSGIYVVKPNPAWNAGSSYELTLAEGWMFDGKAETIRTAAFSMYREEVENLQMRDDIVYIRDTDSINYRIGGWSYPQLTSGLLEDPDMTGTFTYAGITEGSILCIYVNKHPVTERTTDADMLDPAVYVRAEAVSGNTVTFAPLTAEDQQDLYEIPDNFPILVGSLPATGGTVSFRDSLDHAMYQAMMGLGSSTDNAGNDLPEQRAQIVERAEAVLNVGDFVTFYVDDADGIQRESDLRYGRITHIAADGTVTYVMVTRQELLACLDLYADMEISGDQLVSPEEKAAMEATLKQQIEESGFAEDAAFLMAEMVTKTDGFRNNLSVQEYLLTDSEGNALSDEEIALLGTGGFVLNSVSVKPRLITDGNQLHFGDGVQLSIEVDAEFEVNVEGGAMVFELSAAFLQEVTLDPSVNGNLVYKEILFIPIPVGVHVGASIDVKSYTAVSFAAEIYTVDDTERNLWETLRSFTRSSASIVGAANLPNGLADSIHTVGDLMDEINRVQNIIDQKNSDRETLRIYANDLDTMWQVMMRNGLDRRQWYNICQDLDRSSISKELMDMMTTGQQWLDNRYYSSLQALMDRYSELLSRETDWVQLVEERIFSKEICYYGLCIGVEVSFVVRTDLSIAMGSNLEYEVGKRYSFWFEIGLFKPTAGSSTMDLIDEQFAFQFYVLGKMGIKAGVKAKIYAGIGTGKLASVGIAAEIGPYVKLHGFYIYEYTRYRAKNTQDWISSERMTGAMHLDFGLYFILSFEAEALGLFEYTHEFLNEEIPLLEAGDTRFYYGFDYDPAKGESVMIYGETRLDKSLLALSYMDLLTGRLGCDVRNMELYNFTLSNPNFSIRYDEDWGVPVIDVDVPSGVRIMECDLTITYKGAKMPFSNVDMTVTVPLMWTNLTGRELKEYYIASVVVGNAADGYTTVWTRKVLKGQTFDLPTSAEVLDLIGWDAAKYVMGSGYGSQQLTDLTLVDHTSYVFDVALREYAVTVTGIQQADGTAYSRTFTAKYGETFDFSDLAATGTRNPATNTYTKFKDLSTACTVENVVVEDGRIITRSEPIDLSLPINGTMADAIGSGIMAHANYLDNSVKAVFSFNGIPHEDVTYVVEKGGSLTAEQYEALEEIVETVALDEFGAAMGIASLSPDWTVPLYNASNFIVNCSAFSGSRSTISFVDNYGPEGTPENPDFAAADIVKMEGAYIGPLYPISRRGYEFLGWFTADPDHVQSENGIVWVDSDLLTEEFTAQKMPQHDVVLFAKWKPLEYLVTFDVGTYGQALTDGADKMVVVYDSTYQEGYVYDAATGQRTDERYVDVYGSLPVPEEALSSGLDQRFVFWYYLDANLNVWLQDTDPTAAAAYRYYGTDPYGNSGDWVRIDEAFDPVVKIVAPTTLRSYWKSKVSIPVTQLFAFENTTETYQRSSSYTMDHTYAGGNVLLNVVNDTEQIVTAAPDATATRMFFETISWPALGSYSIGYRQTGVAQDDYLSTCRNAGTYLAHVERAEDRVFRKAEHFYDRNNDPRLVINRAERSTEDGSLGTAAIYVSNPGYTMVELDIRNSYALDIHEDATLTFVTEDDACQGCTGFIHSLDPGTTYSGGITVKVTGDPNYLDATMDCSGSFTTLSEPSGYWVDRADTDWYYNDTSADTFEIGTAEELAGLAVLGNVGGDMVTFKDKTIRLTDNIDLTGYRWLPVFSFQGTFDGNGYMISGMYISATTAKDQNYYLESVGLFGHLHKDGLLVNVVLGDAYIYANRSYAFVGALAGDMASSTIDRCVSYARIVYEVGSEAEEVNCGGIVGTLDNGTVVNCVNYGKITSEATRVGGIVGYAAHRMEGDETNVIANCANYGYVSGQSRVGGICGVNDNESDNRIYNCINVGTVYGEDVFTGAIIGRNHKDDGYILHNYYLAGSCTSGKYGTVGAVGKDSGNTGYIQEDEAESHYNNCSFNASLKLARDCGYGTALITALDNAKDETGENYARYGALAWERGGPGAYPIPMQTGRREDLL